MRALVVAAIVAWCATAFAQPNADELGQANKLFLEGRELLTAHDTKAACDKFEQSIALDPTAPGVMLNLGLCYEMLAKYATSLYWFRRAQVAAAEAKLPDYEAEAKRHTLDLSAKVPILKIDASAAPPTTEVLIDGKLVAATDYARVEIDRGSHTLEARAPDKQPYHENVEVISTDAGTVTIPTLIDATTPPGGPIGGGQDVTPTNTTRFIVAGSAAAVGLGLCITSPIWASHTKSAYDDALARGEKPSMASAQLKQHLATGMFVAGAALVGVGVYLYLTAPTQHSTATAIAPLAAPDLVGVAVTGTL